MREFKLPEEIKVLTYLNSVKYNGFKKYDEENKTFSQSLDQKLTWDVLNTTCKCILKYVENDKNKEFHHNDFFNDKYSIDLYSLKKTNYGAAKLSKNTHREYDKLFSQIFESLSYTNILIKISAKPKGYRYRVNNFDMISLLAKNQESCVCYVCINALKILKCANIENKFKQYISNQTKNNLLEFKALFSNWLKETTNHKKDINQIFQKLINPLFYLFELPKYHSCSRMKKIGLLQSISDLSYFRIHVRDKKRRFGFTRKQMIQEINENKREIQSFEKQKMNVKKWNREFYGLKEDGQYMSEVTGKLIIGGECDVHHIKMRSEFNYESHAFCDSYENLILLSKDEHASIAHSKNNQKIINRDNLNLILEKQYFKILKFSERNIGSYDKKTFYNLICLIKNYSPIEYKNDEMLNGYIEDLIYKVQTR